MKDDRAITATKYAILLLALIVTPSMTLAQTATGGTVVIDEERTVDRLTLTGGKITINSEINGDVIIFGGEAILNGKINGDATIITGSSTINGDIDGALTYLGGNLVTGTASSISQELTASAGNVDLSGQVGEDVSVNSGTLSLRQTASIGGNLRHRTGSLLDEGGTVEGRNVAGTGPVWYGLQGMDIGALTPVFTFYWIFTRLLAGSLFLIVFPYFSKKTMERFHDHPLHTTINGIGTLFLVPALLIVLALTLIGLPIAIIGGMIFAGYLWIAGIYGSIIAGSFLTKQFDDGNIWASLVLGLLIYAVLGFIPFIGTVGKIMILIAGTGATASTLRNGYSKRKRFRSLV